MEYKSPPPEETMLNLPRGHFKGTISLTRWVRMRQVVRYPVPSRLPVKTAFAAVEGSIIVDAGIYDVHIVQTSFSGLLVVL